MAFEALLKAVQAQGDLLLGLTELIKDILPPAYADDLNDLVNEFRQATDDIEKELDKSIIEEK